MGHYLKLVGFSVFDFDGIFSKNYKSNQISKNTDVTRIVGRDSVR